MQPQKDSKMEPVLLLRVFVILVVIDSGTGRYHGNDCRYQFNVWEPNGNMLMRMDALEVKFSNFSNYVDKELFNYKLFWSYDIRRVSNWTYQLKMDLVDLKVSHIQGMTKVKDIETQIASYLTKLDNIETSVNELAMRNLPSRAIRKKHIRRDQTLSQSDSPEVVSFGLIKNMVGDLKSEWIVMKRELIDLKNRFGEADKNNIGLKNDSVQIQMKTEKLRNDVTLLQLAQKRHANDVKTVRANVARVKQDLAGKDTAIDTIKSDIARVETGLAGQQTSSASMKKDIMNLQAENEFLKKQLLSNPKGSLVLNKVQHGKLQSDTSKEDAMSPGDIPKDCSDVVSLGHTTSGVYQIQPPDLIPVDNVYCEIVNNTGYTVVQRRTDGLQNFNRGWLQYKVGFGNLYGEFWGGNEFLHQMTKDGKYGLRVDIWDWEGNRTYAIYETFIVSDEGTRYSLHVTGYSGNAGDSFTYHDNMKFSTVDLDNDLHMRNCASENKGGWWYSSCYFCQLNGIYHTGWYKSDFADGIVWYTLKESETYSLRKVEMKLWKR